jgi:aryl-alcohol dehydrogenase
MSDMPIIPIRAAVLRTPGRPLKIECVEMEGPRDDEVLVRVVASGICHTDIDFCESGGSDPVVLGHEGVGVGHWDCIKGGVLLFEICLHSFLSGWVSLKESRRFRRQWVGASLYGLEEGPFAEDLVHEFVVNGLPDERLDFTLVH